MSTGAGVKPQFIRHECLRHWRYSGALLVCLSFCAAVASSQTTAAFFQPGKLRALIITGRNNHDWRSTTPVLRQELLDTGRFDVRVTEEPAGMTSETLAAYDVLVLNYNGPRWGTSAEQATADFVKSG